MQLFVSDKAVSRWECGTGFPDINQLQPISEILGVSLVELLNAKRMEEHSVNSLEANDAVKSAFSLSEREILSIRNRMRLKLLLVLISLAILLNLYFGQAFEWLLGTRFSFERPFLILYYFRHLIAAIALMAIGASCLIQNRDRLIHIALTSCVLSVASTVAAIIIWRVTYGAEMMTRIDYVCLALFSLSTVLLIIVSFRKRIARTAALQVSLWGASFCVFCPVLFSMVFQNHAPIIESVLKSISLSSPMLFLAFFLRTHFPKRLHSTSEQCSD